MGLWGGSLSCQLVMGVVGEVMGVVVEGDDSNCQFELPWVNDTQVCSYIISEDIKDLML